MRHIHIALLPLIFSFACGDKAESGAVTDSGETTGEETDGGGGSESVDWADATMETSKTFTGAYASGAGLFVVAEDGTSFRRSQGEWEELPMDVDDEALNSLWGTGSDATLEMIALGDAGWTATWTSTGWIGEDIGTANLESASGVNAQDLVAVGWGGVYRTTQGEWQFQDIDGSPRFNHVWYDGTVAFAVGEEGAIGVMQSNQWSVTQLDSRDRLYGVSGTSATDVWAVGEAGVCWHFDGASWSAVEVPTSLSLWSVVAITPDEVYAAGNNGIVLRWDGTEWIDLPTGVSNNIYALSLSSNGSVWAIGNRGLALRYDR